MPPPCLQSISNIKSVHLICDAQDEEAVESLDDYLFDQGYEVSPPLFEGEEADIAQAHRQKLAMCDSVLIYYGPVDVRGSR